MEISHVGSLTCASISTSGRARTIRLEVPERPEKIHLGFLIGVVGRDDGDPATRDDARAADAHRRYILSK